MSTTSTFAEEWQQWHRSHEERRTAPHGYLSITSIRWLDETPERYPNVPGEWREGPDGVVVELAGGEVLLVDGVEVRGRHAFGVLDEDTEIEAAFGDDVVEIARRGEHHVLRPRHPESERRTTYAGTPAYDPDPAWAVPGHLEPFAAPTPTTVGTVVEGLESVYAAVGEIVLEVAGTPLRLLAFGRDDGGLHLLFRDTTSGVTTSPTVRSLGVAAPDDDGRVVVDFNRATNLPCVYTPYSTCPLPPGQNVLPVAIEAGERVPA